MRHRTHRFGRKKLTNAKFALERRIYPASGNGGQSLENTGFAPLSQVFAGNASGAFPSAKAANDKSGKKGTAAKAAPYLFVFGHIRSVFLLTSAKAGFGSAEDASRSGGILLTDMRWEHTGPELDPRRRLFQTFSPF